MSPAAPSPSNASAPLRFRWGVFVTVLILAAAVVAAVWMVCPPKYTAVGHVIVESPFGKAPMQLSEPPVPLDIMDRAVADQVQRLKGEGLLRDLVTNDQRVRDTEWFKSGEDANARLDELTSSLEVKQVPQTNFIAVTFSTKNPQDAPVIVNKLIDRYIAHTTSANESKYKSELDMYRRQEQAIQKRIEQIHDQQAEFMRLELSEPGAAQGINVLGNTWRVLAEEAARMGTEKLQYQAAYQNLKALDASHFALAAQARAMIEQDPQIAKLRELKLMHEMEIEASGMAGVTTQPADSLNRARLEVINRNLAELAAAREKEIFEAELDRAERLYLNAMQAEQQLLDRIEEFKARQRDLDRQMAVYQARESEYKLLEEQLRRVSDYINQLQMLIQTSGVARVSGVKATVPLKPNREALGGLVVVGLIVALLVGVPLSLTRRPRKRPSDIPESQ